MIGLCLASSILYQATVNCNSTCKQKRYKGIFEVTFKKRYANQRDFSILIRQKMTPHCL